MNHSDNTEKTGLGARALLKMRDFRLLWMGQVISNFGDALTHLTLVLFINRMTDGSTQAIAWLLIALALPMATLGLIAGVFVDRWRRRTVMIVSDLLRSVLTLGFVAAAATGQLWIIYLLAFLHASVSSFFTPARSAIIPRIVPKEGLMAANSLAQMTLVFARVLGVSIAGFLVGTLDTFNVAFILDAITFALSAFFISQLSLSPRDIAEKARVSAVTILKELGEGGKIIAQNRVLAGILASMAVTMLGIGALNVLLTPMIVNEMNLPETWFGAVNFAQTVGMIIGGALATILASRFKPTNIVSGGLVILGIGATLFVGVKQIWHIFPVLFVIGLVIAPLNASVATIMQTAVVNEILGRVSSALNAIIQTSSLISMFFAGAVAALVGVRSVFVISGAIVIVAGFLSAWIFRGYSSPEKDAATLQPASETT
jgi:MFS family permease